MHIGSPQNRAVPPGVGNFSTTADESRITGINGGMDIKWIGHRSRISKVL